MFCFILWIVQLSFPFSMAATQDFVSDSKGPKQPSEAAELSERKVLDYFQPQFRGSELVEDAVRLSRLTRPVEIPESLLRQKIVELIDRIYQQGPPGDEMTLEGLVMASEIESLVEIPESGPAMRKFFRSDRVMIFSRLTIAGGSLAATYLLLREAGMSDVVIGFIGGWLAGSIQAGPLAEILKAMTSWILNPITEFLKVLNARYTAGAEQSINNFLDRYKPIEPMRAFLNIAHVDRDGMDFAGMSPREQFENWNKNRRMWIAVAKTYGQLNRDTHHHGRYLIVSTMNEEQGASALIQTLLEKLAILENRAEAFLLFHRARLSEADSAKMYVAYDNYKKAGDEIWKNPDWPDRERRVLRDRLNIHLKALQEAGFNSRDISQLEDIQAERVQAIEALVAALTLNEVRSFKMAEANRNLEGEARRLQRVIRKGLKLQDLVNEYQPLIQRQMRLMGYKNEPKCQDNMKS